MVATWSDSRSDRLLLGFFIEGASKNEDFFVRASKHRAQNRSLHVVNEDSSTELTQLSRKKTIFRGALEAYERLGISWLCHPSQL